MAYSCFVSYDTRKDEEVFAYRLQTLAGASGIQVLLPLRRGKELTDETKARIATSDLVIAFLTSRSSVAVRQELSFAQGKGKRVVALRRRGTHGPQIQGVEWLEYDENELSFGHVERWILNHLQSRKNEKDTQNAVLLSLLGLGLLALLASGKKSAA